MTNSNTISHIYKNDYGNWIIQSNEEHCNGVATLASGFASEFEMEEWGRMIGLVHDRGKERDGFQSKIRKSSGFDIHVISNDESAHSFVGASLLHGELKKEDALHWMSNAVAGHHRGLYNIDELTEVLKQTIPYKVNKSLPKIKLVLNRKPQMSDSSHICRMLFSCLVDADRLDTERFMSSDKHSIRTATRSSIEELKMKFDSHIKLLTEHSRGEINDLRNRIQNRCEKKSHLASGFYSLSVPTGGGKTLASLSWALSHCLHTGKNRIIIAIPYTSIVTQTSEILKRIFGANNVLEHHSTSDGSESSESMNLACENWDAPIIVTTNVQLFESMFSNKPSKCRKLHSICNSVIILDEVQTIPISLMQPIVNAMSSYKRMFGVSFLFSTATQPIFEGIHKGCGLSKFIGIEEGIVTELTDPDMNLYEKFKRVIIKFDKDDVDLETISEIIRNEPRVLCIVNTRKIAYDLFSVLQEKGVDCIHLSKNMCQAHIRDKIYEIKIKLKEVDTEVRVISTQLIEAGVDIDFPVVMRQMAGLDSILQAAGRCNREGKMEKKGNVTVFNIKGHVGRGLLGDSANLMRDMIRREPGRDWFSLESIKLYYKRLFTKYDTFDKPGICERLDSLHNCQYEEISDKFKMIEDTGINVIVNYEKSEEIIKELKLKGISRSLLRRLGRYSVSIHQKEFNNLMRYGLIEEVTENIFFISNPKQYDSRTGINIESAYLEDIIII